MTKEQKKLLVPHAKHFSDMVAFIVTRDRDELAALQEACEAASDTNCGWDTYRAAQYMLLEIKMEQRRRRLKLSAMLQHQRLKNRAAASEANRSETA